MKKDISTIWDPRVEVPSRDTVVILKDVELITIKPYDPEVDGYHFHHGAAIFQHHGTMFCSIGANKGVENTVGETAIVFQSVDGGRSWSNAQEICPPERHTGISHGVFLEKDGELWAFHAQFGDIRELPTGPNSGRSFNNNFPGLVMKALRLNERTNAWIDEGVAADNIWPNREPVLMDNGKWFVSGMSRDFLASTAVSNGDDLMKWEATPTPLGTMRANEAAAWVDGANITLVMRNHTPSNPSTSRAAVSVSVDFGRTWRMAVESNMPLTIAKPYCGTLSTGQRYLVGNSVTDHENKRRYLTVAVSRRGEQRLSCMFLIRDVGLQPSPRGKADVKAVCYPHAIEMNGSLYVAHSAGRGHNLNNIDLAIVPVDALIV